MMNKLAGLFEKFGSKIPKAEVPWSDLTKYQSVLDEYLATANMIFPVQALLTILIAYGTFRAVLLVIWIISFIRSMLPF